METIIAEDVTRCHSTGRGVHGVSLSVRAGRCLGVLGDNGSGKTTLTRLVAGLDRPDCGRMSVLSKPACPRPNSLRRRCGVALDTPAHWDNLSGRRNLWFFARQYGLSGPRLKRRVDELLSEANLIAQADEPVAAYSFGMRRKLSVIEAICHDPDLLILDEPSAGTDTDFRQLLTHWIRLRCQNGKTTWIADNNADWLSVTATDAALLCHGRVKATGVVPELIASVSPRSRIEILLAGNGFDATPSIDGIEEFRCEENRLYAESPENPELTIELLRWITSCGGQVRSMEVRSVTLREALMKKVERKEPEA